MGYVQLEILRVCMLIWILVWCDSARFSLVEACGLASMTIEELALHEYIGTDQHKARLGDSFVASRTYVLLNWTWPIFWK